MTRCSECKRKLTPVETIVGPCAGCKACFCVHHRSSHFEACHEFQTVKAKEGKEVLAARLRHEATKSSKGLASS
jgi:hypothetical protein